VLRVKSQAVKALLQYFTLERNPDELMKALKSIPAHDLRFTKNNQQVDAFFPHASKAFWIYYIPLFMQDEMRNFSFTAVL
jgi:hypothetical protein